MPANTTLWYSQWQFATIYNYKDKQWWQTLRLWSLVVAIRNGLVSSGQTLKNFIHKMIDFLGLSHEECTLSLLSPTLCSTRVLEEIRDQLVSAYKQRVKSSSWKESPWGSFWSRLLALLASQKCWTNYMTWFTTFCFLEESMEDPSRVLWWWWWSQACSLLNPVE